MNTESSLENRQLSNHQGIPLSQFLDQIMSAVCNPVKLQMMPRLKFCSVLYANVGSYDFTMTANLEFVDS